jgi:geranylgeranylglycerol-phosphate geranylgeranyltransferase
MTRLDWAPRGFVAHMEMMRPYTLTYPCLLAIAGAQLGSVGQVPAWRVGVAACAAMAGWEAGHYVGDYSDREIDLRSKPSRPLPSGRVSSREVLVIAGALIGAGYVAASALGLPSLTLAVAVTILGVLYATTFKGRTWLGHLDRGILGASAVVFGAIAGAGNVDQHTVGLAVLVLLHDAGTNIVGALRDVEGDKFAHCATMPVAYGTTASILVASSLAALSLLVGGVLLGSLAPQPFPLLLFACAAALSVGVHGQLLAQRRTLTRVRALTAHKCLVAERLLLLAALVAVYAPLLAGVVLAVALPGSLALQALLRDRYEDLAHERCSVAGA